MQRLLPLAAVFLLPVCRVGSPLLAQEAPSIMVKPHYQQGEQALLQVEANTFNIQEKRWPTPVKFTVRMEVIEAYESSFVIRTTMPTYEMGPEFDRDPLSQMLVRIGREIPIDIELNESGRITGVKNWQRIRREMSNLIPLLLNRFGAGLSGQQLAEIRHVMEGIYATPDAVRLVAERNYGVFFVGLGRQLTTKPIVEEGAVLSLLGGESLRIRRELYLSKHDPKMPDLTVRVRVEFDPESLKSAVGSILQQIPSIPVPRRPSDTKMQQEGECVIERKSGWTVRGDLNLFTAINGSLTIRTITWRRIQPTTATMSAPATAHP